MLQKLQANTKKTFQQATSTNANYLCMLLQQVSDVPH